VNDELEKLILKRKQYMHSMYISLFQIILVLLVPSVLAAYLGNYLKSSFETGSLFTLLLVIIAISLSWVYIYRIYKKTDKEMCELDKSIREIKKQISN
jgi:uncharacterized membrane protein (DUF485 family)